MTQREKFEEALRADRCDAHTRLVYADWLEENGLDDEAAEQRRMASPEWVKAAEWMQWFAYACGPTLIREADGVGEGDETRDLTFDEVVDAGIRALGAGKHDWDGLVQWGEETARSLYYEERVRETYWKHWRTITGRDVGEDDTSGLRPFSCSC